MACPFLSQNGTKTKDSTPQCVGFTFLPLFLSRFITKQDIRKMEVSKKDKELFNKFVQLCAKDINSLSTQLSKEIYSDPQQYNHLLSVLVFESIKNYITLMKSIQK